MRTGVWVLGVLFIGACAGTATAFLAWREVRPRDRSELAGTYVLYQRGDTSGTPVATMRIWEHQGSTFKVGIASPTGIAAIDWQGRGTILGQGGHYDWVFPDGKTGRTTLSLDAAGNLIGQVRGSGIDWDYVGKRKEGPVRLP